MEEENFEAPLFERMVMVTAWQSEEREAVSCLCWGPFRVNCSTGVKPSLLVVAIFPPQDELISLLSFCTAEEGEGRGCRLGG